MGDGMEGGAGPGDQAVLQHGRYCAILGGGETAGEVGTCCGGYMGWLQVQQKKISVLTRSA